MATATAMQQGRINKTLSVRINFGEGFGIMTRKGWLEALFKDGNYYSEVYMDHPFGWNREKYNRMRIEEQEKYEKKYEKLVEKYKIQKRGKDSFTLVTKIEFDYFNSLS